MFLPNLYVEWELQHSIHYKYFSWNMSNMTAEHGTKIELFHIYDFGIEKNPYADP